MPSVLLTESIAVELGANEPWPQDVKLFQEFEVEQILVPSNANSLSVQAFLRMCGLDFEIEMRKNAEQMSPSGTIPFLKCGSFVISEFDPIVSFVSNKGIRLSQHLDDAQQGDMRAYMSLVNSVLVNAELYISWCHKETYEEVTKPRYSSFYPWPLNEILVWRKRNQMKRRLNAIGWKKKSLDEIYNQVDECCRALSDRLNEGIYFFNNKPTELDALVFGHLFTLLTTSLLDDRLATIIRSYKKLVDLCLRIERDHFERRQDE
ncbi:hypothetical protein CHUAL_010388 [Chamberlinius hualienensis]